MEMFVNKIHPVSLRTYPLHYETEYADWKITILMVPHYLHNDSDVVYILTGGYERPAKPSTETASQL